MQTVRDKMGTTWTVVAVVVVVAGMAVWTIGCRTAPLSPVDMTRVKDGTYEGETWKMLVGVKVEKGRIADIEIRKQFAPAKYTALVKPMAAQMVEKQTVEVDGITGATMSSTHLKRAVQEALSKAAK